MIEQDELEDRQLEEEDRQELMREEYEEEAELLDLCALYGVKESWRPETEADYDWVLEKIADEAGKIARITKNYQSQLKTAEKRRRFFEERYGADLEAFARKQVAGRKKGRFVQLLNGRLSFTKVAARIVIDKDDSRVVAWAKAAGRGELVKTTVTESVNRTELAKQFRIEEVLDENTGVFAVSAIDPETGLAAEIATVTPEGERFKIA